MSCNPEGRLKTIILPAHVVFKCTQRCHFTHQTPKIKRLRTCDDPQRKSAHFDAFLKHLNMLYTLYVHFSIPTKKEFNLNNYITWILYIDFFLSHHDVKWKCWPFRCWINMWLDSSKARSAFSISYQCVQQISMNNNNKNTTVFKLYFGFCCFEN